MLIEQLSIFVENKHGRLAEIADILRKNQIDIRALSIADTQDFGIMRIIVDDPVKAEKVFKEADCTVSLTKVIAMGVRDVPGGLAEAMDVLNKNDISIEYMYSFISRTDGKAFAILRVEDNDKAVNALRDNGIKMLSQEEINKM